MLTIYRRHRETCPHTDDRYFRKCRCAVWCEGTVEGRYQRQSLKTRSWERAEELKRELEDGKTAAKKPGITDAIAKFTKDAEARNLTKPTVKKYRVVLNQLSDYAKHKGFSQLSDFDSDTIREFRATWKDSAISSLKKLERLRAFFRFCVDSEWLHRNPAKGVKPPIIKDPPTLPYSKDEMKRILDKATGKWHTLCLVLRYSGLRIGDAMKLTPGQIDGNKLFLYMQKTRVPVYVPLPESVVEDLKTLPLTGGYYFWNREGESKLETATGNARRALRKIFTAAKVTDGHPHRFRDTFAVELLLAGVPLPEVSILLGHSSIKVTEKSYAPWVQSRQQRLEELVSKTWEKPKLVRVK